MTIRKCDHCKKPYTPTRNMINDQRFCSNYCRAAEFKGHPLKKTGVKCKKPDCKNRFDQNRPKQVFCSVACKWEYFNARRPSQRKAE
jgi:hypothetical protein